MLNPISTWRHIVVAVGIAVLAMLGTFSVIGAGDQALFRAEHFDAKYVSITPADSNGVTIREVVDVDFGLTERHGYQRIIPNDYGAPTAITASSPDANVDVDVIDLGSQTRIRLGDPALTVTGQHRYELQYTLPDARIETGRLAIDVIGTDESFQTDRFTVDIAGFELVDTACDVGSAGQFGGCDLTRDADRSYRVVIEPLESFDGLTVSGTIVGTADLPAPITPQLPARNERGPRPLGLAQLLVGAGVAAVVYLAFRRLGTNQVFGAGGAADAAFAPSGSGLPVPVLAGQRADVPTYRVPDSRLADLATIEFVPPSGIGPWQGNALLRERVDDQTVSAWFSEMIACGAIETTGTGNDLVLHQGQGNARLRVVDRNHLTQLFGSGPAVHLGKYQPEFAETWKAVRAEQRTMIAQSGWWSRSLTSPGSMSQAGFVAVVIAIVVATSVIGTAAVTLLAAVFTGWLPTLAMTFVLVGALAALVYQPMLASRTAIGSALTLRTESFRRFLAASEGRHVDWAWKQGVIREYSAWAVALGAAEAWSRAIEASSVERPDQSIAPLLLFSDASSFHTARTSPAASGSSSGFSSGGGFGGGGVGGGGGGGSSGSW